MESTDQEKERVGGTSVGATEEFKKIVTDFIRDIKTTFPEYTPLVSKWWKEETDFQTSGTTEECQEAFRKKRESSIQFIHQFCVRKYPSKFFAILNEDEDIFSEESEIDTEFLPFIHFKNIWDDSVSESTKKTIWKYLQLILFSVVNNTNEKHDFGDTAKLFGDMNEEDFKAKLNSALDDMKGIFENNTQDGEGDAAQPNVDDIHDHLSGMFGGKLGNLAREIAEETAQDMNIDTEGATDVNDVFNRMFKNPGKLMSLVQNVGGKLDEKMKSGDINEAELMKEVTEMMNKMQSMPGMGDIQSMMSKMGMNMGGSKMDVKGMEQKMKQHMKLEKMREQARQKTNMKKQDDGNIVREEPKYTDAELIAMMGAGTSASQETAEKPKTSGKKKGKKGKKKQAAT